VTDRLADQRGGVEDGKTFFGGDSDTLATQNFCKRIGARDTSRQLGWRVGLGLEPIDPADSLGFLSGRTNWLTVDVEDSERETEMLRVEVEVTQNRIVPGTSGVSWIRPQ